MHCHICDSELSEKEISWNKELGTFEPCTVCLDIAMEAAYCDGFLTEEDESFIVDTSFDDGPIQPKSEWLPRFDGDVDE